jgi:hypothetical protein
VLGPHRYAKVGSFLGCSNGKIDGFGQNDGFFYEIDGFGVKFMDLR